MNCLPRGTSSCVSSVERLCSSGFYFLHAKEKYDIRSFYGDEYKELRLHRSDTVQSEKEL